jgi:hypothetical protein
MKTRIVLSKDNNLGYNYPITNMDLQSQDNKLIITAEIDEGFRNMVRTLKQGEVFNISIQLDIPFPKDLNV